MFKEIKTFVLEDKFKLTFIDGKINIVNYSLIPQFDSNKIMIEVDDITVLIKGDSLVISKLLNDEVLIEGKIKNIEFR